MLRWTLNSLAREWGRVLAGSLGIALGLTLALYLDAVFRGEAAHIVAFIDRTPGEVWVLQDGVENLHMSYSSISENAIAEVGQAGGIERLIRVVYRPTSLGPAGEETYVYAVGVPEDADARARWHAATGWPMPAPGKAIIPAPMLRAQHRTLGGKVRIGDRNYVIQGISRGTYSMANPIVLLDERDARDQFDMGDGASILIATPAHGVSPADLAHRIEEQSDKVRALTKNELVTNDADLAMQMGAALIGLMSVMGLGVAGLIVVFVTYAFVSAHTREFALAKALGARKHHLMTSAMIQAGVVAVLGAFLAFAGSFPLEAALGTWVPQVAVDFSSAMALGLGAATLGIAQVAAMIPTLYILKVDPGLVFNG